LWKALIAQRDARGPHALAGNAGGSAESLRLLTALLTTADE